MTTFVSTWPELQEAAGRARVSALHEQAIELYTEALAQPDVPWEQSCAMALARSYSRAMLGDYAGLDGELTRLAEAAADAGDEAVRAAALAELTLRLRSSGELERGLVLGHQAVQAAQHARRSDLEVQALCALGFIQVEMGDLKAAREAIIALEGLWTEADALGRAATAILRGYLALRAGEVKQAARDAELGYGLARAQGWREWEILGLELQALAAPDLARRGLLMEQALAAATESGNRTEQMVVLANLSGWLVMFGLYERAVEGVRRSLDTTASTHMETQRLFSLQYLAQVFIETGDLPAALSCLEQALVVAEESGNHFMRPQLLISKAQVLLYSGKVQQALDLLGVADPTTLGSQPLKTNWLAHNAAARRMNGEGDAARDLVVRALGLIPPGDQGGSEYPLDELCWICYRAMAPIAPEPSATLTDERWRVLDLGFQALLVQVDGLGDAGLRRGYLHRVQVRRSLVREWLRWAPEWAKPEDLAAYAGLVQRPGRLGDVVRRLLEVGVRLSSQRDPKRLPHQIVDEVAELTGAERIALILIDPDGNRRPARVLLPSAPVPALSGAVEPPADEAAFLDEIRPWLDEAAMHRQGIVRPLNAEGPLLEQRSVMAAPLISLGRLVGIVYCDVSGCFGRFEVEDLELLGVLANQSAVALDNADWSATLEQRVALRTAELEQSTGELQAANRSLAERNNELAIINDIQQALASQLEFGAIVDLVGDKVTAIFAANAVLICLHDRVRQVLRFVYEVDNGRRIDYWEAPIGPGLSSTVIETRRPLLIRSHAEAAALVEGRGCCSTLNKRERN